jgi:probable phosphoglycerate mutase
VNSPELRPLYDEAKKRIAKLDKFGITHVLRGKNKDADRLANEAMDKGTGLGAAGRPGVRVDSIAASASSARQKPVIGASKQVEADLLREVTGFVKNGVVHLVEGELPEGTFVRILPGRQK